jgi:hypothetical protein
VLKAIEHGQRFVVGGRRVQVFRVGECVLARKGGAGDGKPKGERNSKTTRHAIDCHRRTSRGSHASGSKLGKSDPRRFAAIVKTQVRAERIGVQANARERRAKELSVACVSCSIARAR